MSFRNGELLGNGSNNSSPQIDLTNALLAYDYDSTSILCAIEHAIFRANISDGVFHNLIGHHNISGYSEGAQSAKFNTITGISLHPFQRQYIILDSENFCIRSIDSRTPFTRIFAGVCGVEGNIDGSGRGTRFGVLKSIVSSPYSGLEHFVYDNSVHQIKKLFIRSALLSDVWVTTLPMTFRNLQFGAMNFNAQGDALFVNFNDRVVYYQYGDNETAELLVGQGSTDGFFAHGGKVALSSSIFFLTENIFFLIDSINISLRVVNLDFPVYGPYISTVCVDGSEFQGLGLGTCTIKKPSSILKHPTESALLIASSEGIVMLNYVCKYSITNLIY